MGRPERPIETTDGALAAFAHELRELRRMAGTPTYRDLSRRAHFAGTTLSLAASGSSLPTLDVTLAYVKACGGDLPAWRQRWLSLAAQLGRVDADNSTSHATQPADADDMPFAQVKPAQLPGGITTFAGRTAELDQQALAVCREVGDRFGEAYVLRTLGAVDLRQGRYQKAASHLQQALILYTQLDAPEADQVRAQLAIAENQDPSEQ
jgi:hypothetical protein